MASPEVKAGLLKSRAKEWQKWMDFNAAVPVMGAALDELFREGHVPLPMQWIAWNARTSLEAHNLDVRLETRRGKRGLPGSAVSRMQVL